MAKRPVFLANPLGRPMVITRYVDFEWHPGLAVSQKQKSIASLHQAVRAQLGVDKVLEVSSKSPDELGMALSAFNLTFDTKRLQRPLSVECAFQGSKVFEQGGPFTDLYQRTSREAKTDDRLQTSGQLTGFKFFSECWDLEPQTAFYDWLYINALRRREDMAAAVSHYTAFTDIEFNPDRSINCQAYSVAFFVALQKSGLLGEVTSSRDSYLGFVGKQVVHNVRQNDISQPRLL